MIAQDPGAKDLNLVIAGTTGWGMQHLIEALNQAGSAAQRIHPIGFVRDEEQAALYTAATAFVLDRKSTRLNSSHSDRSRMPSSA